MDTACPNCGARYTTDLSSVGQKKTCPNCGSEFVVHNPNLIPCPDCYTPVSRRAPVCPHCGAPLAAGGSHASMAASAPGIRRVSSGAGQEQEIMVCRPSVKNYLVQSIVGILTIPLLIGIVILAVIWFKIHFTCYLITNVRIVVTQGWIARTQHEIWIKDMREANLSQSFWQRVLNIGDVSIGTAATAGTEIYMEGVSNPMYVVATLNSLRS